MSLLKFFRKDKNVEDQTQVQPEAGAETVENQNQEETVQDTAPLRVFVAKEAIVAPDGSGTVTGFKYTDKEGQVTEVAADSELVGQLDAQIESQPEPTPEAEKPAEEAPAQPEAPAYAKPEFQVLDVGGNVVRSYNAGEHEGAENARECAEKFAAKVNGTVSEITE